MVGGRKKLRYSTVTVVVLLMGVDIVLTLFIIPKNLFHAFALPSSVLMFNRAEFGRLGQKSSLWPLEGRLVNQCQEDHLLFHNRIFFYQQFFQR